jgi:hypothetical protein
MRTTVLPPRQMFCHPYNTKYFVKRHLFATFTKDIKHELN